MDESTLIVGVDFDGTCVEWAYPEIGEDVGAVPWLRALDKLGARLVLWTVRDGEELRAAVKWFEDHDINLWGVNENPMQAGWSASPKAHCHVFVDDAALGAPLMMPRSYNIMKAGKVNPRPPRPHVDWDAAGPALLKMVIEHRRGR